ncbi:glutathione S-transferase family protein [Terasakiella sp. A23]|uniref:glutathione S-transferase family protein n=1 Tax=Terasakiella sp. FCG-A23 TaxID=3080561 RepID=UPI00295301FD|nr:glutathione S-transferase family protein [Terasakiella sp. A23]MDV7338412.1 glutathione S-transferase family protein [Terasakiella sp. A23]
MGLLVDGTWQDQWYDTKTSGGKFKRQESQFRNWIKADGSTGFTPDIGRYRLYVSLACPWAHRTLIFRKLKGLENAIDVVIVQALMGDKGWILPNGDPLHTIYTSVDPHITTRVTVPILWDKQTDQIVSNESAEIIRMLNSEFGEHGTDYYPEHLRPQIDEINTLIYNNINNGVYKTGFATTQEAYEEAYTNLFNALDRVEEILSENRYLVGDQITEADWRLFTTLVRFDAVYVGHFKCNKKRIIDYPNIWSYLRELYQVEGVAETLDMDHIKTHYYGSHKTINPTGIIPVGPEIDFMSPHGRG